MQVFPEGYTVSYALPLTDLNDAMIVNPLGITVRVENDRGEQMVQFSTAVSIVGDIQFDVAGVFNTLGENSDGFEGRFVTVTVLTATNEITKRLVYMIKGDSRLVAPTSSFQTLQQAQVMAFKMVGVDAFQAANETLQENALLEAYLRITRISLKVASVEPQTEILPESRRWIEYTYLRQLDWPTVEEATWREFPVYFTRALMRAQIAEANAILVGDPIGTKRRAGIISESTGEASMMFRNGFLDLGVSNATLENLTGLIHYDFRITR